MVGWVGDLALERLECPPQHIGLGRAQALSEPIEAHSLCAIEVHLDWLSHSASRARRIMTSWHALMISFHDTVRQPGTARHDANHLGNGP